MQQNNTQSLFGLYYQNRSFFLDVDQEKIRDLVFCDLEEKKKKTNIKLIEKVDKGDQNRQFFLEADIPLKNQIDKNWKTRIFVKVSNQTNYIDNNPPLIENLITSYAIPYIIRSHSPHFTNFIARATCSISKERYLMLDSIQTNKNINSDSFSSSDLSPNSDKEMDQVKKRKSSDKEELMFTETPKQEISINSAFLESPQERKKQKKKIEKIETEKFMDILRIGDEELNYLKTIANFDGEITKNNWNFLITEAIDKDAPTLRNLYGYIFNYSREKQNEIYDAILFQMIWSVLCLNTLGINHNDLHDSNIFVKILKQEEIKEIRYYLDEENYFSRKDPVFVKIIDLDLATWPNVLKNTDFFSEDRSSLLRSIYNQKVGLQDFYKVIKIFPQGYYKKDQLQDLANLLNTDPKSFPFYDYFSRSYPIFSKQIIYDFFSQPISANLKKMPTYDNEDYRDYFFLNALSFNIISGWNIPDFIFSFLCGFFSTSLKKTSNEITNNSQTFTDSAKNVFRYFLPKKDQEWGNIIAKVEKEFNQFPPK